MSGGFENDIIGGGAALVRAAIKSPNFVHGVSGWSINKDGTAEFQSVIIPPGSGGNRIFTQGTTPASPNTGDLWINTSSGNEVSVWNGSAWTPYQWGTSAIGPGSITAALIAANTITAGQLAAGIIYAGIVDATTVQASQYIATSTQGEFLAYSGAPATGNLVTSIAGASGSDSHSNSFVEGVEVQDPPARIQLHVNNSFSAPAIEMVTGVASEFQHPAIYSASVNAGAANETITTNYQGPASTFDHKSVSIEMASNAANGTSGALGFLLASAGPQLEWGANGLQSWSPNNFWQINGTKTDVTARSVTGTTPTPISPSWALNANDANVGTMYVMKCYGRGTQMSTSAQDIVLNGSGINGTGGPWCNTQLHISATVAANTVFNWEAELAVLITATGSSGSCIISFSGTILPATGTVVVASPNFMSWARQQSAITINTTTTTNITLQGSWTVVSGSGTLTCNGTSFERRGL